MVYSDVVKVYGPYKAKDSRLRVVLAFKDGSKKTVSYPKYIMEIHLGRYLTIDETVDHIDCDPLLDLQTQEITVTKYKPKSLYLSESDKGMESNSVKPVVNGDTEPSSDKSEKV